MSNQSGGATNFIVVIVLILVLSILIPTFFVITEDSFSKSITEKPNETAVLTTGITTTYIVNDSEITVIIANSETGETTIISELEKGQTDNTQILDETITVTYQEDIGPENRLLTYEYPTYLNWPPQLVIVVQNIFLILLGIVLLLIIALATAVWEGNKP